MEPLCINNVVEPLRQYFSKKYGNARCPKCTFSTIKSDRTTMYVAKCTACDTSQRLEVEDADDDEMQLTSRVKATRDELNAIMERIVMAKNNSMFFGTDRDGRTAFADLKEEYEALATDPVFKEEEALNEAKAAAARRLEELDAHIQSSIKDVQHATCRASARIYFAETRPLQAERADLVRANFKPRLTAKEVGRNATERNEPKAVKAVRKGKIANKGKNRTDGRKETGKETGKEKTLPLSAVLSRMVDEAR